MECLNGIGRVETGLRVGLVNCFVEVTLFCVLSFSLVLWYFFLFYLILLDVFKRVLGCGGFGDLVVRFGV